MRDGQRGLNDPISVGMVNLVERKQPFADYGAILDGQLPDSTGLAVGTGNKLIAREARVPFVQPIEVLHGRPHSFEWRLDLYALDDPKCPRRVRPRGAHSECSSEGKSKQ